MEGLDFLLMLGLGFPLIFGIGLMLYGLLLLFYRMKD